MDAFNTFCVNPSPEGSAFLSKIKDLTFLASARWQRHGRGRFREGIEMRVAIYARVSARHRGQETANQLLQLRECCQAQNWSVLRECEDHESGGKSERTAFQQKLRDAAARR